MFAVLAEKQYIGAQQWIGALPGTWAAQQRTVECFELGILFAFVHIFPQTVRHIEARNASSIPCLEGL